jgi:hypothetical protein
MCVSDVVFNIAVDTESSRGHSRQP